MRIIRLIGSLAILFSVNACMSVQQYNETVTYFEDQQVLLNGQIDSLTQLSDSLKFDIARREGENKALLTVQDKLQDRLDVLQEQMENLGDESFNKQESLSQEIQAREEAIAAKEREIEILKQVLESYNHSMDDLYTQLMDTLSVEINEGIAELDNFGYKLMVSLPISKLFSSTRPIKLSEDGLEAIEDISKMIEKHPDKYVTITGHTDNSKPNTRYYKDNWDLSALEATAIARVMIEEFYLSSNQVIAAAKGEFAPKSSNATKEGKSANKRVELVITTSEKALMRKLQNQLDGMSGEE